MYVCMYVLLVSIQSTVVKAVMEHFKFKISVSWTVAGIGNTAFLEVYIKLYILIVQDRPSSVIMLIGGSATQG